MSGERILIVEDELLIFKYMERILKSRGYDIAGHSATGEGAVKIALEQQPQLILMDILLKGNMDGIDTSRKIREKVDIPIIYITAHSDDTSIRKIKATQPYGYIVKPINEIEFFSAIEIALYKHKMERKLKESEERYRDIFENSATGMSIVNLDNRFLQVNNTLCSMLGYSEKELLEKTFQDITHEDDIDIGPDHLKQLLEGEIDSASYEKRYVCKNGMVMWVSITTTLFRDFENNPLYFVAQTVDITDRKVAEEFLKIERDRAQEYLDIAGVIILALDTSQNITLINKRGCEVLECDENNIVGKNWFECFIPDTRREKVVGIYKSLMAGKIGINEWNENIVLTKNRVEKVILWHNTILKDEAGNISGILSSGEDITERKVAEIALKEGEEIARALINTPTEPVLLMDTDGIVLDMNEQLSKLIGLSSVKAIGKSVYDYLGNEYSDKWKIYVKNIVETKKANRFEGKYEDKWFDTIMYPVTNPQGNVSKVAVFSHDITETRRLQKEIMEIDELERKRIGQELHDSLGQKLTGIGFLAEALKKTMLDKSYPEVSELEDIIDNVADSVDHARKISSGLWTERLNDYDAVQAIKEAAFDAERLFGITCTVDNRDDIKIFDNDIVKNLYYITGESINNAVKHGSATIVDIAFHDWGDYAYLEIKDNGKVVDKKKKKGVGLGLRIMNYRAHIIGAELTNRNTENGYVVEVKLKKGKDISV
ncbi:PAS domain S-box protein [Spirochaetota bacterium]